VCRGPVNQCLAPSRHHSHAASTTTPTALRWGVDNRTCALRLVGHGQGMRVENRVPVGGVNPYLALAALVAGAWQ